MKPKHIWCGNKNEEVKCSAHGTFRETHHRVTRSQKIGKPNDLKVFGRKKTKTE